MTAIILITTTSWVTTRSITIAGTIVGVVITITIAGFVGSISLIHKVHITEIPVVVFATLAVFVVSRVAGTRGTGLHVAVTIGTEDKGFLITEVQTIISTVAGVHAIVGVGAVSSIVGLWLLVVVFLVAIRGRSQSQVWVGWSVVRQVRVGVAVGESVGERIIRGKSALQAKSDGRLGSAVAGPVCCSRAANLPTC